MIIRFGYVAMSINLKNASPSKTMTATQFKKIRNRGAAIKKLERIALTNLHNTLRHIKYNRGEQIHFYRFSSRLIPLVGHELVKDWDFLSPLKEQLLVIGQMISSSKMRVGFHPEHFTLINSPRKEVFKQSVDIIKRHVDLLKLMGLSSRHRNVLHVGSKAGGKEKAMARFISRFSEVPKELGESLLLENDDKIFTAEETLQICEELTIPMVLDLHHDYCNPSNQSIIDLWPRIKDTWNNSDFPPKIHISSPKSKADIRAHADFIRLDDLLPFLQAIKTTTPSLDVMIEAKQKDNALFDIMDKIVKIKGVEKIDPSTIEI